MIPMFLLKFDNLKVENMKSSGVFMQNEMGLGQFSFEAIPESVNRPWLLLSAGYATSVRRVVLKH